MMRSHRSTQRAGACLSLSLSLVLLTSAAAAAPLGWRTDGTSRYTGADVPLSWSKDQNVLWSTELPHWSNATPVVSKGRIFVCAEPNKLVCLDADTGEMLWQAGSPIDDLVPAEKRDELERQRSEMEKLERKRGELRRQIRRTEKALEQAEEDPNTTFDGDPEAARAEVEKLKKQRGRLEERLRELTLARKYARPRTHGTNGFTSPTPVTDGRRVFVLFATGVAAAYDMDGNRLWITRPGVPAHGWGHSASPALADGKVVVHVKDHLKALDPETGAALWSAELKVSWGSPVGIRVGGKPFVVTPRGDVVRASDGKPVADGLGRLTYATPVFHDNVLYFIEHGGTAVGLSLDDAGELVAEKLWETRPHKDRYYASALPHGGLIYAVTQKGLLSAIDASTGDLVWTEKLRVRGTTYPSIVLAGDSLLASADRGTTVVLEPGRQFRKIGENHLEHFRSTPVIANDRIYIRGMDRLWCIGKE